MKSKDAKLLNGLALAYIGDAIYELEVRRYLLEIGETKPQHLHRLATEYVSARGQAKIIKYFQEENLLSEEEYGYFKRGRNSKINTKAKNTDIHRYLQSTGYEALMGYLYLTKQEERLNDLIRKSIQYIDEQEGRK
ncbi:MAG: Mini-ribonuclease 3 [Atopostipes suicloacalis]|nr:Mini-ribonuclease 3 [Atopostipes suicloacalis]MDN6730605.1 Mini-ribonuclease 3 [Atopostipes suicloacalis]